MFRFVSFFSFVSAYLGLENTKSIKMLLSEPVSINVSTGTSPFRGLTIKQCLGVWGKQ